VNRHSSNVSEMIREISKLRHLPRGMGALVAVTFFMTLIAPGTVDAQKRLPMSKKLTRSDQYVSEMREVLKKGIKIKAEAGDEQNVKKLNCVNDVLFPIKGLVRVAESNLVLMHEAVAKKNQRDAQHEFVKITIAHSKVMELDGRIRSCGSPTSTGQFDGRPIITRIKDPDLPTEDPLAGLYETIVNIGRPPSASPFF
jgi:hypothetical protein